MKKVLIACICLLCCFYSHAQPSRLIVSVTDTTGRPVSFATVILSGRFLTATETGGGTYVFENVPAGSYRLRVTRAGYEGAEKHFTVSGRDTTLAMLLRRDVQTLEEVFIENDPVKQRRQSTQLTVETVQEDFLRKNLGGSLMQSLEKLPGIQMIGIGSANSKPLLRGLGFDRVVVLDQGVKHQGQQWGADHGLEIDQFAAQEIEVVKGAASFAYGSDAVAGVIDVKPPSIPKPQTTGGSLLLTGKSNNDLIGGSLNLYGRAKKWYAAARLTVQDYGDSRVPVSELFIYDYKVNLHKHFLRNTAGRELDAHFTTGYTGDRFSSVLLASRVFSNSGFFANAHGLEPRRVDTARYDRSNRDILMPSQEVTHLKLVNTSTLRVGNHRAELTLGYQNNLREESNPYVNHGFMPPIYPADMKIPRTLEREFDKNTFSFSLKDRFKTGRHDLEAGVNAEHQHNQIGGWSFLAPAFEQTNAGVYAYDKMRLNENTLLHGALRYDYHTIDIHAYTDWFPSQQVEHGDTISAYLMRANDLHRDFHSITGAIGLNYNAGKWELKANLGKSFRAPIAKELGANGVNYHYFSYERGNEHLRPEESYQLDVAAILQTAKWTIQATPFFNYFPNYIYLNPTPDHDYLYGAGNQVFRCTQSRVRRYGAELQASYRISGEWTAGFSGEWVSSVQLSGAKQGYTLPFSPPPSALMNLTFEPADAKHFRKNYLSADLRLTGSQNKIVPPERKTAGYTLLHIQAGTTVPAGRQEVQFNLQIQNVFNQKYLNHTSFYRLIALPEQGRNIILTATIPFTIK